jgi:hypothetical protein
MVAATRRGRQAQYPLAQQCDAIRVDGVARQRRHAGIVVGVDAHQRDGTPGIVRRDYARAVHAFVDQHGTINELLFRQRCLVARIEVCDRSARTMAVRAVGIEIRAGAVLQAAARIGCARQRRERA